LGAAAALICTVVWALTAGPELRYGLFSSVFQGASLAIIFYIITYYIIKNKFFIKVEKPSKLFTQGIGAYFLTWIVSWVLFYTLVLWLKYPQGIPLVF